MSKENQENQEKVLKLNVETFSISKNGRKAGAIKIGDTGKVIAIVNHKALIKMQTGFVLLSETHYKIVDAENTVEITDLWSNHSIVEHFDLTGKPVTKDKQYLKFAEFVKDKLEGKI